MSLTSIIISPADSTSPEQLDRRQPPHPSEGYHCVEFDISDLHTYQFKLWNSPSRSFFVLVKEGSAILERLRVGKAYKTRYYTPGALRPSPCVDTRIQHITKNEEGRFKGHYLVGLSITEPQESPDHPLMQTVH